MKKINVGNGYSSACFKSSSELAIKQVLRGYPLLIPEYSLIDRPSSNRTLFFKNEDNISLIKNGKNLYFNYPEERLGKETIGILLSRLIEVENQEKNIYTLHSSSVEKNGRGILLLGHSGSGKTTVATDLCLNHGYHLISGDLTLIERNLEGLVLLGGVKDLHLRKEIAKKYFNKTSNQEKVSVLEGVSISETGRIPLEEVYFIDGDNQYVQFEKSLINDQRIKIDLHNGLSSLVTGSGACLLATDGSYIPLPQESFETRRLAINRKEFIDSLIGKEIIKLRGDIEAISREITK